MTHSMKSEPEVLAAVPAAARIRKTAKAEEVALTREQEAELSGCAERIVALGRRSTSQAFEYGAELSNVQAILPAKRFGAWLKAHAGMSTKSARNYTRVYNELAWYRDRMEAAALAPTAMFALLGADDADIEDVLETLERGEHLTIDRIKDMVSSKGTPKSTSVNPLDMPGRAGCLKLAEQRMKTHIDLFYGLLTKVLTHVESAVETFASGKNVAKTKLAELIEIDCRHANDLFELTLAPLFTDTYDERMNWKTTQYGTSSGWGRFQKALHKLGGSASWPDRQAFRPWIVDEVYPLLKFVVRGEPLTDGSEMSPEDIEAEARAIRAREERRALNNTRILLSPPPSDAEHMITMARFDVEDEEDEQAVA